MDSFGKLGGGGREGRAQHGAVPWEHLGTTYSTGTHPLARGMPLRIPGPGPRSRLIIRYWGGPPLSVAKALHQKAQGPPRGFMGSQGLWHPASTRTLWGPHPKRRSIYLYLCVRHTSTCTSFSTGSKENTYKPGGLRPAHGAGGRDPR